MPSSTTNCTLLPLGTELTIAYAAASRELILQALEQNPQGLALDLSAVTEFDSAGVQLLLATAHSLAQRGQALQLHGASSVVEQSLSVFGLQHLLDTTASAAH